MSRWQWTLRRRLVVAIVALLAAVSLVIGAVSVATLRDFLIDRLDAQLTAATGRSQNAIISVGPGSPPPASGYLSIPGQPEGTVGAIVRGSLITGAVLDREGNSVPLTLEQAQDLASVAASTEPRTLDLAELGEYRVVVEELGPVRLLIGLPMSSVNATVWQLALVISIVSLGGLAAAGLAGAVTVRLSLRPLERVVSTATLVSDLPLDRGDVALAERVAIEDANPATEVGKVGAAINRMLGHIASALAARQASEQKLRNFVADASHELRTPLAAIRGYAELTRRGGHDLPPDVVHAMSRVESESVRMTKLVEELLLLARLDEGRELEAHDVDLGQLLEDAVSDAKAADSEHEWLIERPEHAVVIAGDQGRLHQVFANLLSNARVHTPAGTTVSTVLFVDAPTAHAVVEVRDDGPGVDPKVLDSVFERFVRGDSSRSRASGSTGLGLSIVNAVALAHGGSAEVESTSGSTVFRVRLPLRDSQVPH
jgi:two-component system OmpR family sensor kinase